jgi:predicted lipoprotein
MIAVAKTPTLFSLMSRLTAEARQKFGEERRRWRKRDGIREELVDDGAGKWRLEYWQDKKKLGELGI